jgi:RND family efflux transporter MFP subunit
MRIGNPQMAKTAQIKCIWAVLALAALLPVRGWAHGEIEGGGEQKTQRIVSGSSGKYRLELMVSPTLPVAGDGTNMELKVVRLLPKADPLLGSEVPVSLKPEASVVYEDSKKVLDPSLSLHEEGEAGVYGTDQYRFQDSGSLLVRFLIHTGAGEDLAVDFPVTVKTNVNALFRLWVNLALSALILGLTGLQIWKIRARGGGRSEMIRPIAAGAVCWLALLLVMDFLILDKVLALQKPKVAGAAPLTVTANEDGSYTISAEAQKTLGITLAAARRMPVEQSLTAYGAIEPKPDHVAEVVAPLWGRIEFSKQPLAVGDKVQRGQELVRVILELSQVERAPMEAKQQDIKGALQKAKERRDAAQLEYDRAQKLVAANPAFGQDLKWAKELLDEANDTYEQIAKEDRNYVGVIRFRDPRRTPVLAPISGTITSIDFTPGQLDLNGDFRKLFTIVDTAAVRVRADVFLADVWKLKPGDEVVVHPAGNPGRAVKGTIAWIGDTVDAVNRTVPVLADVANPDQQLALGGFVRMEFPRYRQKAIAVPEEAVVDDGATKRIYVAMGGEKFQPMQVQVGVLQNGWWQVLSGVQEGDRVIARGAALMGSVRQEAPEAERGSLTEVTSTK